MRNCKVIAILPAYNAARTLVPFLRSLPRDVFDEIILVDDCSTDGTYAVAKQLLDQARSKQPGLKVYQTPRNLGYGGNLKMCLSRALDHGADVIVELHPDGEYLTDGVEPALDAIDRGAVLVLGNRFAGSTNGMYWWKKLATKFLSAAENIVLGTRVPDLHQGFRVYTKKLLETINFRATSNDYLFSFEIIAQAVFAGMPIATVPVFTRYTGKKRGARLGASIRYAVGTLRVLLNYCIAQMVIGTGPAARQPQNLPTRGPQFWGSPPRVTRIPCPNCRSWYLIEQREAQKGNTLYFCKICMTGFIDPMPTDPGRYYSPDYWNQRGVSGWIKDVVFRIAQRRRTKWVKELLSGGNILDVGAGEGRFGMSLGLEYYVTSLEAPFACIQNPAVLKKDFLTWRTNARFDSICFWESLEHVESPQASLTKAAKLLSPGGYLLIEYPRFNSLESRIFGRHWFHRDVPRHVNQLTDEGLQILLSRAGLTPIAHRGIVAFDYGPWGFLVSLLAALGIPVGDGRSIRNPLNWIIMAPLLVVSSGIHIIFWTMGASPIGLVVAQKMKL